MGRISELIQNTDSLQLVVNAEDLREFAYDIIEFYSVEEEQKRRDDKLKKILLTKQEVIDKLGVSASTFWRLEKEGFIPRLQIMRGKAMYRLSDVEKFANGDFFEDKV